MSISNKDQLDSDLLTSLPAAAAALSAEDRAGLVNALKNTLQNLALERSDILETLSPQVRKRVDALRELQGQHDELQAKFLEEKAALEAKYEKLYEPLYTKRYEIVNGVVELEGVNVAPVDQGDNKGTADEDDEEALEFLKEIKWCRVNDPKGFKLEFFFDTNPFFKNSVLTKTYHMIGDDEHTLEKAIGTDIEWYPGKCLTRKILKKRQKKGLKNAKPEIRIEECESFFNFFKPPQVPEDDGYDIDNDTVEKLQYQMEQDYEIGSTIRDKIIPHAVSWFIGELAENDDSEDTEDEDKDEEEKCKNKPSGPKKSARAQAGQGQQGGERPSERNQE
ncbi:hypothetical protein RND71_006059 [Anisodus tanguticus]|uniref:Uncharacterized protein n=1 Tax=Anisodus tanguticus TaxID=243964 RepID=A0AAE1VN96_9SOLA|nr:hypothetical protein RND71_006059 [Anisodus tanguticus]